MDLSGVPEALVKLSDISEHPGPYCMSFRFELESYIRSIETFGLIQSPFLVEDAAGTKDVVIGFRRILALKSMGWDRALMKVLSMDHQSPKDLLLLNLYDNLTCRRFNDVEKGMVLNRLKPYFSGETIRYEFMPLLGLPSNEPTRLLYEKLEDQDMALRRSCAEGELSMKTIKALMETDPDSRFTLFQWIKNLRFNFNQQLLFIDNTIDISIKEGEGVSQVLQSKPLIRIKEDTRLNLPQKAKYVLAYLKNRKFPFLTRSEEAFETMISNLKLPERVKISHSPFFEDPDYRLEIRFRDGKALGETVKKLSQLNNLEGLGNPWEEKP